MIENLSIDTVIIVACVCGSVVLILSIVLIVLCCQRRRTKDLYEKTETNVLEPAEEAGKPSSSVASLRPPDSATVDAPTTPPSSHQPQHLEDNSSRDVSVKDCHDNVRVSYRASNPALAGNYPSLNRGTTNSSTHQMNSMTSAADATDDKRPRKVIYEVIV